MTTITYLCVGGPLDGQYRTTPDFCISFRVVSIPPVKSILCDELRPVHGLSEDVIEYQLIWSSDHGRMVWWAKEGDQ